MELIPPEISALTMPIPDLRLTLVEPVTLPPKLKPAPVARNTTTLPEIFPVLVIAPEPPVPDTTSKVPVADELPTKLTASTSLM